MNATELTRRAQALRKNATKEERRLWYDFLRTYPLQFRRQKVIGGYIADFFCDQVALVVELDGGQHYEPEGQDYDARRTAHLNGLGIRVLRFSNLDVTRNFQGVCQTIDQRVKEMASPGGSCPAQPD